MKADKARDLARNLTEHFTSAWRLLSDTTIFLSTTKEFYKYESMLRQWRKQLALYKNNPEEVSRIRKELIDFRAALRKSGYTVSLGSFDIKLEGFRNDTAQGQGFKRAVFFITDKNIHYITGDDNHRELDAFLERRLINARISAIKEKHYLWYRWRENILILSGSDTESREDFEHLKILMSENKAFFIRNLKKI